MVVSAQQEGRAKWSGALAALHPPQPQPLAAKAGWRGALATSYEAMLRAVVRHYVRDCYRPGKRRRMCSTWGVVMGAVRLLTLNSVVYWRREPESDSEGCDKQILGEV